MSYSHALTAGSHLSSASSLAASSTASRAPPDILTYCYESRMVYVVPGETYDKAIDIAQESFPELKDVDRERICFEVRVVLSNHHERRTAEIGRTAWSVVVGTLARFEIVEIRIAPSPKAASLGSSTSTMEPPPYASDMSWYSNGKASHSQTHLTPYSRGQYAGSSQSLVTRVADLFTPRSSRRV